MESIQLTKHIIAELVNVRSENSHKGMYGHALLLAGNPNAMGSAVISAKACLRAGLGLLTVNVPQEERICMQTAIPEAMLTFREQAIDVQKFTTLGIGPGFGFGKFEEKIFKHVLATFKQPIVVDADALTLLSLSSAMLWDLPVQSILTPHPKEFDRLFGAHAGTDERKLTAILKAKEYRIVIVLKDHQTYITDGEVSYLNTTGNAGLAKGGSGDALTGIITSLLAQHYTPIHAACVGVYLHGLAADIAVRTQSEESVLISDVIEVLGEAFGEIRVMSDE